MSRPTKITILPPESLAGPALSAVTMVMTFLACLALGCSLLADRAADRWLQRATSALSVQIVETGTLSAEEQLPNVLRELRAAPGVESFRPKALNTGGGAQFAQHIGQLFFSR